MAETHQDAPEKATEPAGSVLNLPSDMVADLRRSGLADRTVLTEHIISFVETTPAGTLRGYTLPYYDVNGMPLGGYQRRRIVPVIKDKYLAPPNSGAHLYIPKALSDKEPNFWKQFDLPIIICEGEKKALAVTQLGFLGVGISGSSAWRSASVSFTKKEISEMVKAAQAASGEKVNIHFTEQQVGKIKKAVKVVDELDLIVWDGRDVYIAFDMDNPLTRRRVQAEALSFAFWLEEQGATVHTIILPTADDDDKVGIDDYLVSKGMSHRNPQAASAVEAMQELMDNSNSYPVLENLKTWINQHLASSSQDVRRKQQQVSRAMLAYIDFHGRRYIGRDDAGTVNRVYYHHKKGNKDELMMLFATSKDLKDIANLKLGALLNGEFNIQSQDTGVISRFADDFKTLEPYTEVEFYRGMATKVQPDSFYLQIGSTHMVRVTAQSIERLVVGDDGVVFEVGNASTEPLIWERLEAAIVDQEKDFDPSRYWFEIIKKFNFNPMGEIPVDSVRAIFATNAYVSPALWRWRGSFLPNEVLVCEPDSGKSSLYKLRNIIWTGAEHLTAPPEDVRTWKANLANAIGMFCVDNVNQAQGPVQGVIRELISQISTSESAQIRERKLFSTTGEEIITVNSPFAFTSVGMTTLFDKQDFLQRSLPMTLNRYEVRDSNLVQNVAEARTEWVAHQLVALRRFFKLVEEKWNPVYQANHRLDNYEQIMLLMAEVLGVSDVIEGCIRNLQSSAERAFEHLSPVFTAYKELREVWFEDDKTRKLYPSDIMEWVQSFHSELARYSEFRTTTAIAQWIRNNRQSLETGAGMSFILNPANPSSGGHLVYKE